MDGHERVSLPLHLHAPSLARLHVHQVGQRWSPDLLEDAVLATSELVANAVQHADGDDITLVVRVASGTIRVEVHDGGDPIPRTSRTDGGPKVVASQDERGRGLFIVDAVADRWGIAEREPPPGKSVWFELNLSPAEDAVDLTDSRAPLTPVD